MVNTRVMIDLLLCGVMYLSSVTSAHYEYILDIPDGGSTLTYVRVPVASTVTLVCKNRFNVNKITWYKAYEGTYADFMNYYHGRCKMINNNYPSITEGYHKCSITFSSIKHAEQGMWYCAASGRTSNTVNIAVTEHTTPKETPMSVTPTATLKTLLTVATTVATLPSKTPEVSTTQPQTKLGLTEENMKTKNKVFPFIAGATGGTVCLMIIITIVIVLVRKRRNSQTGTKRTDYSGRIEVNGQGDYGGLEDVMGGDYAQMSDTTGVNIPKKSDSVCRKDCDNDELVMADNPLYIQYNQEDNYEKRVDKATSSHDTVSDVYSVVQKPSMSETTASDVYSVVMKTAKSQTTAPDVYSLPLKSQTLSSANEDEGKTEDQTSDEANYFQVTDVYSVVQKPAKM